MTVDQREAYYFYALMLQGIGWTLLLLWKAWNRYRHPGWYRDEDDGGF